MNSLSLTVGFTLSTPCSLRSLEKSGLGIVNARRLRLSVLASESSDSEPSDPSLSEISSFE